MLGERAKGITMWRSLGLGLGLFLGLLLAGESATAAPIQLALAGRRLAGQLVDYTHNHGRDRRIWSEVLGERRDLYVYLPPGYDPARRYPVMIWLHGLYQDERSFLLERSLHDFDEAIAAGRLPPLIIVIPDGSLKGRPTLYTGNPLWLNSQAGRFEDYLVEDIWGFVQKHYPVRPEREAHVLAGFSGGGAAAFRLGIKHPSEFGVVMGTHPPLNLRWLDCHGRYFSRFDPSCWGWRDNVDRGSEPVARFYGVLVIRVRHLVYPLFGKGPESVEQLSQINPIEMIDQYNLKEGDLAMFIGYTGKDQFNVTAQVESFLYRARERGLTVSTGYLPRGRHDWPSANRLRPGMLAWLAQQLAPLGGGDCLERAP
jgi:S-formylglutathione hydrolase FrmB